MSCSNQNLVFHPCHTCEIYVERSLMACAVFVGIFAAWLGMARIGGRGWPAEWLFSTEIRRILVFRRFARPKRWTGFAFSEILIHPH